MLRERRAPGVIVKGSNSIDLPAMRVLDRSPRKVAAMNRAEQKAVAETRKRAAEYRAARGTSSKGDIRLAGSVPLSEYRAMRRKDPNAFRGGNTEETLRRMGGLIDG